MAHIGGFHLKLISTFIHDCNFYGIFSFISRFQKSLHGSADDIGWLQWTPGMAPVIDGTSRFLELLDAIRSVINLVRDY